MPRPSVSPLLCSPLPRFLPVTPLLALPATLLLTTVVLSPRLAQAESLIPKDATWGMTLDAHKVMSGDLAETVEDLIVIAIEEEHGELPGSFDEIALQFIEMVGIDPYAETATLAIFGNGFNPDDASIALAVGEQPTNIEGLLLATPGYESEVYQDTALIHRIEHREHWNQDSRFYITVLPGEDGIVLGASQKQRLTAMIDQVNQGASLTLQPVLKEEQLFKLWLNELPPEVFEEQGPQSNIARMIQRIEITGSEDGHTRLNAMLTMENQLRARQVAQFFTGGLAMLQLAAASEPEELEPLAELMELVEFEVVHADPAGAHVQVIATTPTEELDDLIHLLKEMDEHKHGRHHEHDHHDDDGHHDHDRHDDHDPR